MKLYKYMPAESFEEYIIKGPTIRFTTPGDFNDPFDCMPAVYDFLNPEMRKNEAIAQHRERAIFIYNLIKPDIDFETFYQDFFANKEYEYYNCIKKLSLNIISNKKIINYMFSKLGIFSASRNNSNILMWSHYAGQHTGIAFSFNSDNEFFNKIPDDMARFKKVKYYRRRPKRVAEKFIDAEIFFTKSKDWEYEQEFRLMLPLVKQKYYIWEPGGNGVCKIPKTTINSIIFGCMCSNKQIDDWRKQLSDNGGFEHLKFYKAEMDNLEYKLNIVPLEG